MELFLIWKTSTGNLERRFRRIGEIRVPERAQLLDVSIEKCVFVEQAPSSKCLRLLDPSKASSSASLHQTDASASLHQTAKNRYFQHILQLHAKHHGSTKTRVRLSERRDAGTLREGVESRCGPETDAAFGRKRAAAIAEVVAASPSKRARMIDKAPHALGRIIQEVAQESAQNPSAASAAVVASVAKREGQVRDHNLRGAEAAAKARAKREKKAVGASQPPKGSDQHLEPARKAGVLLVGPEDEAGEARRRAQLLRFTLASDPLDFVARVLKLPSSSKKGHVVIARLAHTDYAVSAMIAAALLGCFHTTPQDFLNQDETPRGIMFKRQYKNTKQNFHVAVSAALAADLPTVPLLLRNIALAPGSGFQYYISERMLCKFFKKTVKTAPRMRQNICVLCKRGDRDAADAKCKEIYITPRNFLLKFDASERAVCPGFHST